MDTINIQCHTCNNNYYDYTLYQEMTSYKLTVQQELTFPFPQRQPPCSSCHCPCLNPSGVVCNHTK